MIDWVSKPRGVMFTATKEAIYDSLRPRSSNGREEKYDRYTIYILIVERRLMMLDAHTIAVREKGPLL
jgi:hypothetical protein